MDYDENESDDYFLPDEKRTPTWLSVSMVLILLIAILGGGFFLLRYSETLEDRPNQANEVTIKKVKEGQSENIVVNEIKTKPDKNKDDVASPPSPESVVKGFYDWVAGKKINALKAEYKDHEAIHPDLSASIDRVISNALSQNYNPFFCSEKKPSQYEVQMDSVRGNLAHVMVTAQFEIALPIRVGLKLADQQWKIFNITCLDSNSPRSLLENMKREIGLDYVTITTNTLQWNQVSDKSRGGKIIEADSLETLNANIEAGSIENYLKKMGFVSNLYNEGGYQKENVVCIASDAKNSNGKRDISVKCGTR